jgi:hypothetical protein
MKDPVRLRDAGSGAPEELQDLLSSAEKPRGLDHEAFVRGLEGVARTAALPVGLAASSWLGGKAAALALATTAAISTAVFVATREVPATTPASAPAPSAPPASPRAVTRAAPDVVPAPTPAPVEPVLAPRTDESAPSVAPRPRTAVSALAEEARLLERARAELDARPARAIEILREHERRFPEAVLDAEHEVIAVEALVKVGRRKEARARAERALARHPGGLYAEQMRRVLEP